MDVNGTATAQATDDEMERQRELRRTLAAKTTADLRAHAVHGRFLVTEGVQALAMRRAMAVQRAIDNMTIQAAEAGQPVADPEKLLGSNEAARERRILLILLADDTYSAAAAAALDVANEVAMTEAELASRDEARRERQAAQRDRELDLKERELAIEAQRNDQAERMLALKLDEAAHDREMHAKADAMMADLKARVQQLTGDDAPEVFPIGPFGKPGRA